MTKSLRQKLKSLKNIEKRYLNEDDCNKVPSEVLRNVFDQDEKKFFNKIIYNYLIECQDLISSISENDYKSYIIRHGRSQIHTDSVYNLFCIYVSFINIYTMGKPTERGYVIYNNLNTTPNKEDIIISY